MGTVFGNHFREPRFGNRFPNGVSGFGNRFPNGVKEPHGPQNVMVFGDQVPVFRSRSGTGFLRNPEEQVDFPDKKRVDGSQTVSVSYSDTNIKGLVSEHGLGHLLGTKILGTVFGNQNLGTVFWNQDFWEPKFGNHFREPRFGNQTGTILRH